MATTLNPGEEAQLLQTVEMFEVIVQSQPTDTQSLEILKEAYTKLRRENDIVHTSKRIAQAYLQLGQLSSAILEYETILQHRPEDADVREALAQIEAKASSAVAHHTDPLAMASLSDTSLLRKKKPSAAKGDETDDGRKTLYKIFVDTKIITAGDFDLCWRRVTATTATDDVIEPFVQTLHEKGIHLIEKSLRLLSEKSRIAYIPLDRYEVDTDLARSFPSDVCRRWCVLPIDKMSKAILVATANPFNQEAAKQLAAATQHRLLWYVASPNDITKNLRRAFR
jgi:tetratricopeptide (TPR) repeat protein